jgi:formylmethanofuran dehydrogenase subunit E
MITNDQQGKCDHCGEMFPLDQLTNYENATLCEDCYDAEDELNDPPSFTVWVEKDKE